MVIITPRGHNYTHMTKTLTPLFKAKESAGVPQPQAQPFSADPGEAPAPRGPAPAASAGCFERAGSTIQTMGPHALPILLLPIGIRGLPDKGCIIRFLYHGIHKYRLKLQKSRWKGAKASFDALRGPQIGYASRAWEGCLFFCCCLFSFSFSAFFSSSFFRNIPQQTQITVRSGPVGFARYDLGLCPRCLPQSLEGRLPSRRGVAGALQERRV